MRSLTLVLLSTASAACISFAVAIGFEPPAGQLSTAEVGSTERLAARIDRLERALRNGALSAPVASADEPGVARTRVDSEASGSSVAELTVRLEGIERKLDALSRDPLKRAYGYLSLADPQARREAIGLLQHFAAFDPSARQAIRSMLDDQDASVRREAVQAIGRIGDREALPRVSSLLSDDDAGVRGEAADAIKDLLTGLPAGSPEFRAGFEALAARATDPDARVREEAADSIGDLGTEIATPILLRLLDDPEDDVRDEAITALGRSGDPSVVPHLRRLYEAGPSPNRLHIAIAMSRLGDLSAFHKEAVTLVANAKNMGLNERERARAVWILGSVDPADYRAVLTQALSDPSSRVRRKAQHALARVGR